MKGMGGVDVWIHINFISTLLKVSNHIHATAALSPGINEGTHRIRGSVGLTANMDDVEKWQFQTLLGTKLGTPRSSNS